MASLSYDKVWESEFDGFVSKRDKKQDMKNNQLKLKLHDTFKKDQKLTTNFEPNDNTNVINKAYLDEKILKINGHLSILEKDYNEFKLQKNKQNVEEVLVQKAVNTTIQILYDKRIFDNFQKGGKFPENVLFTTRRRGDLSEQVKDAIK